MAKISDELSDVKPMKAADAIMTLDDLRKARAAMEREKVLTLDCLRKAREAMDREAVEFKPWHDFREVSDRVVMKPFTFDPAVFFTDVKDPLPIEEVTFEIPPPERSALKSRRKLDAGAFDRYVNWIVETKRAMRQWPWAKQPEGHLFWCDVYTALFCGLPKELLEICSMWELTKIGPPAAGDTNRIQMMTLFNRCSAMFEWHKVEIDPDILHLLYLLSQIELEPLALHTVADMPSLSVSKEEEDEVVVSPSSTTLPHIPLDPGRTKVDNSIVSGMMIMPESRCPSRTST